VKRGDRVQVRCIDGSWIDGEIAIASSNGKSLAVLTDRTVAPGRAFGIIGSKVALLLYRLPDDRWRDVASDMVLEVKAI
jgi:hypothetical protein